MPITKPLDTHRTSVSYRLEREVHELIRSYSELHGVSQTEFVHMAVRDYAARMRARTLRQARLAERKTAQE